MMSSRFTSKNGLSINHNSSQRTNKNKFLTAIDVVLVAIKYLIAF